LPSQPPVDDGPSSSHVAVPSAPPDPDEDFYDAADDPPQIPEIRHVAAEELSNGLPSVPPDPAAASAPNIEDLGPSPADRFVEDKQELERRRLLAEASSPSDFPDDTDNAGEGPSGTSHEPTAPVLTEEYEYCGIYSAHQESLPRYER
jgi:arrestin-related trafficking adapter 9